MRLTHIKLSGFKSFTDPTTIHVPGQLVAVIGPNGCGKSNVIDAVRWVLGEASAKQLRGESMQDVIFNGAATRRPSPRASVELIFDNSDQTLQGAWGQYAEISIKRQLTRQGESSYYINNQIVRRRDITDLFLGTGVGARGYAVIEQGMISRIIEARPEELRAYIEEAAGVSKYKERRKETEGRLKDTREHLQRLSDLQTELARQVEKLEKQAATAEHYQKLSGLLSQQQDLLDFVQWQNALNTADKASEQHQTFLQQQNDTAEQIQTLTEQIHQLQETIQLYQDKAHGINNQRSVLREQTARLEEQIRHQQNLHQRLERDKAAAQTQLQKIHQEQQHILKQIEESNFKIEEKQTELAEWAIKVAEHEERLPELEETEAELEHAYQNQQEETNRLKRELALKQQQLAHTQNALKENAARQIRLQQENTSLNLPDRSETEAAQEQSLLLQSQQEHYEEQLLQAERELEHLKEKFQTASTYQQQLEQQHLTLQVRQQALNQLVTAQSSDQSEFWHSTQESEAPQLWQSIQVTPEWQQALSIILSKRLYTRAVSADFQPDTAQTGHSAAWISKQLSGGVKNVLPARALLNQIQTKAPFQTALHHWLDGVLCAPDLNYALTHQNELQNHQIWLTPEGHQVDKISVVLFGKHQQDNLITQKKQLDELSSELSVLSPKLNEAEQQLQQTRQMLNHAEQNYKNLQQQQKQHNYQYQTAQTRAAELLARTNQGQLRRDHIERELLQLEEETIVLEHASDGLHQDITTLSEALNELEQQYRHTGGQKQLRQNQLKQAQLALLESNRQYGLAEIELHKIQQQKQNLEYRITELEQQSLEWQERQSELALAFETGNLDTEQRLKLENLGEEIQILDEQYQAVQDHLAAEQEKSRNQYAQQQALSAKLPQLQAATQTALLQQQEALLNAKRYYENLQSRQADTDALAELAKNSGNIKFLNSYINDLAREIEALGPVNLAALQELEDARERDNYYRTQSEDVQSAIDLLEEAIAQIDGETKSRFKETFDAVNEKVQTFFPTLFGGGEATLHMIGEDLLSAGVSIMARPPGKKNSTIHLLSGGEKALTAMSLVFALFSLNPAPFCLLDEVDAPLDDANTSRFCNLVKEMSAQTQFLYISHNRLTMEMAEQLIGVTMQEKGVSRIVAVDIQQALKMAEPN